MSARRPKPTPQMKPKTGGLSLGGVAEDLGCPVSALRGLVDSGELVAGPGGYYSVAQVAALVGAHPELVSGEDKR